MYNDNITIKDFEVLVERPYPQPIQQEHAQELVEDTNARAAQCNNRMLLHMVACMSSPFTNDNQKIVWGTVFKAALARME
jgi:hypothetical protein